MFAQRLASHERRARRAMLTLRMPGFTNSFYLFRLTCALGMEEMMGKAPAAWRFKTRVEGCLARSRILERRLGRCLIDSISLSVQG